MVPFTFTEPIRWFEEVCNGFLVSWNIFNVTQLGLLKKKSHWAPAWLVNLPPPNTPPPRNKGLIAGLIKGNQWLTCNWAPLLFCKPHCFWDSPPTSPNLKCHLLALAFSLLGAGARSRKARGVFKSHQLTHRRGNLQLPMVFLMVEY